MKLATKTLLTTATAFASLAAVSTQAATITNAVSWPTTPSVEVIDDTQDGNGRGVTESRGEQVQSFTTLSAFKIDKIYMEVASIQSNIEFNVRIFSVTDVENPVGTDTGNVLLTTANTGSAGNGILEIDLIGAEEVNLNASSGYAMAISLDDGNAATDQLLFAWRWATSDVYAGGRSVNDQGRDYDFSLAFTGGPVPEPGSLALLGLGGLCVLRRRRG